MADTPRPATLDVNQLLRVVARRKWLLIVPWTVAFIGGAAAAFLLPPIYFSQVTMLLEHPRQLSGPLGGMVGGGGTADQQAEVMREQVQSSLFLRSVITASGIKTEPATRAWALQKAPRYAGMSEDESIEAFLIEYLRDAITIRRQRGDVFQLIVGDTRKDRAQRLAESVANQFVISSKASQLEAVRATQEFSVEQQQIYKHKLEDSEARLDAARRATIASAISGSEVTSNNLARARGLIEQADLELEDLRQRIAQTRSRWGDRVRENDPAALTSPQSTQLVAQLVILEKQLASAMLTDAAGDQGSSTRVALARKSVELEAQFQQTAAVVLPGLSQDSRDAVVRYRVAQADLEAKSARRAYLASQVADYESQTIAGPDRDLTIARLQQEVDNNRTLYNSFLEQSAAAQISEAFENAKVSGRFRILEPANLPRSPGKPNRPMLLILSLLAGAVIGIGIVLLVEQHDQSMKNAEEVESLLGLPVLGAVPRVDELQRQSRRPRGSGASGVGLPAPRDAGLLHRLKVESPLGLEFRRIYLNLARARGRAMPKTLLLTSATRGEGKTTTTACLAITLARELHEKMLLVDFDLRSPTLHRALGLPGSSWGLAQILNQRNFDERFVRSTVLPNLDFLPAGKSERPAAELIDNEGVEWFIREATARYPLVVIDSAPNLAVPDSLILGRAVEGVLYVIKAGSTVRKAAEYGVRVQREANENVIGVLLNDVGDILPQYYGYRSSYGYSSEAMGGEPS
jgi:capsular exopolysaccharide synthesis family protein